MVVNNVTTKVKSKVNLYGFYILLNGKHKGYIVFVTQISEEKIEFTIRSGVMTGSRIVRPASWFENNVKSLSKKSCNVRCK